VGLVGVAVKPVSPDNAGSPEVNDAAALCAEQLPDKSQADTV
jgi:hypothetical protein